MTCRQDFTKEISKKTTLKAYPIAWWYCPVEKK